MSTLWNKGEKTVIVTGGTKGIGYETASGLAALGATVLIVGRDAKRGATAVSSIQQRTGNAAISFLQADLSSLADVRRLAGQITSQYDQIHVLVNNAGGVNPQRILTAEGLEATFVTNHLGPFLLTNLLLPSLQASAPARIINVNSNQHRVGRIDFADLQGENAYDMMRAYQQAKLANLFFTYELARRLRGTNVTVNAADPGGTLEGTKAVPLPLTMRLILPLLAPLLTAKNAAQSSIYLASSPDGEALTGKYVNFRKKVVRSSPISYEEATAEKLWRISASLVGLRVEELAS
jgi:NAD(P)-dependent dehydrogenase (short-subunit alcohol dehydrogenase family)